MNRFGTVVAGASRPVPPRIYKPAVMMMAAIPDPFLMMASAFLLGRAFMFILPFVRAEAAIAAGHITLAVFLIFICFKHGDPSLEIIPIYHMSLLVR